MGADHAASLPEWVPPRMALYKRRSRSTRWLMRRPEHLLAWWLFLTLFGALGILLTVVGVLPVYFLPGLLWAGWLQPAVDRMYIPRAFRAWRRQKRAGR